MIKILIVDDEQHAREELVYLLKPYSDINIVAECRNAIEALKSINHLKPDVIFLDIKMPQITGIELASMLDKNNMPRIVFVTAYDEYAIEAIKKNAIDYLLKPVNEEELEQTLQRIREDQSPQKQIKELFSQQNSFISCFKGSRKYFLNINDIEFVYSHPLTGVHLMTKSGQEYHTTETLIKLEQKTPLIKCHQQHLINISCVKMVEKKDNSTGVIHTFTGHTLPVGRRYMDKYRL